MPLQNRVDPFGVIHAVAARGMFTGNRGVIHDPGTRTLLKRRWSTKAWIICECDFRGRRRDVFGRNGPGGGPGWTNLFFLDEVTALAAGHRPCFFCRREKAREFLDCFGKAFGIAKPKVTELDARLHRERLASGGKRDMLDNGQVMAVPDGAMIAGGADVFVVRQGGLLPWNFNGYRPSLPASTIGHLDIRQVTPRVTLAVFAAGFRPIWHDSATPNNQYAAQKPVAPTELR